MPQRIRPLRKQFKAWRWLRSLLLLLLSCGWVLGSSGWLTVAASTAAQSSQTFSQLAAPTGFEPGAGLTPPNLLWASTEPAKIELAETGLAETGLAETTHPAAATAQSPIDQGKAAYGAGHIAAAIAHWQAAARQVSQPREQVIVQNYLAIAYQDLGQWQFAQARAEQAWTQVNQLSPADPFLRAQVLNTRGGLALHRGQADQALTLWQTAEQDYRQLNAAEALVQNQLNQIQALRALGFYGRARQRIDVAIDQVDPLPDGALKLRTIQSLGAMLRLLGEQQHSEQVLDIGVALAEQLGDRPALTAMRLSLAQTLAAQALASQTTADRTTGDQTSANSPEATPFAQALALYQQVQQGSKPELSSHSSQAITAQLGELELRLAERLGSRDRDRVTQLTRSLTPTLLTVPPSRWGIYAQVQFANLLLGSAWAPAAQSSQRLPGSVAPQSLATILGQAVQQSRSLDDPRAEAYTLTTLGQLYHRQGQTQDALALTRRALTLAQQAQIPELLAQGQWQQGWVLAQSGQTAAALAAYDAAFQTTESLQLDLVTMGPEVQFSFRERVEPAYRAFVQLLLQGIDSLPEAQHQSRLEQAREVMEALQLAELQNYFRQACLTYDRRAIETIDPKAAVVYPILLDGRIDVILSLPNQPLRHYGEGIANPQRDALLNQLYASLNGAYSQRRFQGFSQQLYRYLLAPAAAQLQQQNIQTLVFVADSRLRNFPMAALYNGQRYLVEDYSVALSPGLQLLNSQALQPESLRLLSAGLTEARQGFLPLPGVAQELSQLQRLSPSSSSVGQGGDRLLNQAFIAPALQQKLQDQAFDIVHLATHGKFSSQASDTYLLTWDGRITAQNIDQLFQRGSPGQNGQPPNPIELLVLSACQTAAGDDRAALGMAGVAVRSGARSTLATLWAVNDQSTAAFMGEFYRLLLQEGETRGEAVRQAQLFLLKQPQYQRPYFWAPFVLVGNWQ